MNYFKILIIDDEPELGEILELVVESNFSNSFEFSHASDGQAAIDIIKKGGIDLIVCDYTLPKKNGQEIFLCNFNTSNIPFIMMSGQNLDNLPFFNEFIKANNKNSFLSKPFFEQDVVDKLSPIFASQEINSEVSKKALNKYSKVSYRLLPNEDILNFDIYLKLSEDKFIKIYNKNDHDVRSIIENYYSKGTNNFYIENEEFKKLLLNKFRVLKANLELFDLPEKNVNNLVKISSLVHEELLNVGFNQEVLDEASNLLIHTVKSIVQVPQIKDVIDQLLSENNSFTAKHSIMMVYLFKATLHWFQENDTPPIENFCLAAFLHDITLEKHHLTEINSLYDDRYSRLDQDDKNELRNHPTDSANFVRKNFNFDQIVCDFIVNHHEKPNGKGFPKGLDANKFNKYICYFLIIHEMANSMVSGPLTHDSLKQIFGNLELNLSEGNFSYSLKIIRNFLLELKI